MAWFPDRVVFVGGGPPVWETYAPYIRHWDINRLPYDGEADRWFDPGLACRRGKAGQALSRWRLRKHAGRLA